MGIRILIADDHAIIRAGLRALLSHWQEAEVVGEASDGKEAVRLVGELAPHLALMDTEMPTLNGVEATRQVTSSPGAPRVLAMAVTSDQQRVAAAMGAGACGYLLKSCTEDELRQAISTVMDSRFYLSPQVSDVIVNHFVNGQGNGASNNHGRLSPRERQVLQLLAEGRTSKEIARSLNVSVKTVDTHRRQIMDKLELRTVAELTKYAIREGITSLEQ